MLDLLKNYSITEIIMFVIFLALAIKGVVDFYDWAKNRIKTPIDKVYMERKMQKEVLNILKSRNEQIDKMPLEQFLNKKKKSQ